MNPEPIRDKRLAAAVTAVMAISTFDMSPVPLGLAGVKLAGRYVERAWERQEGNVPAPRGSKSL